MAVGAPKSSRARSMGGPSPILFEVDEAGVAALLPPAPPRAHAGNRSQRRTGTTARSRRSLSHWWPKRRPQDSRTYSAALNAPNIRKLSEQVENRLVYPKKTRRPAQVIQALLAKVITPNHPNFT